MKKGNGNVVDDILDRSGGGTTGGTFSVGRLIALGVGGYSVL